MEQNYPFYGVSSAFVCSTSNKEMRARSNKTAPNSVSIYMLYLYSESVSSAVDSLVGPITSFFKGLRLGNLGQAQLL